MYVLRIVLANTVLDLSLQVFVEPAWSELLPPPYPPPHQKPYTLLLSIDDLLVTSTWDVRVTIIPSIEILTFSTASTRVEDRETTWSGLFPSLYLPVL